MFIALSCNPHMKVMRYVKKLYFYEITLKTVDETTAIAIIMLTIDVFLEPILSITIPSDIPPRTSPRPKLTIPKSAYES